MFGKKIACTEMVDLAQTDSEPYDYENNISGNFQKSKLYHKLIITRELNNNLAVVGP